MKKISIFALLAIIAVPAFAETVEQKEESILPAENLDETQPVVYENAKTEKETVNPKVKFPHGLQLGVGVSATSGLNGFVGYANKNFDSFWLKRFGIRADFATTAPLKSMINSGIDSLMGNGGSRSEMV